MLTNDGNAEGLFRAAFMNSGFPIPVGDITKLQYVYDGAVLQTGCSNATDTLDCLRKAPLGLMKEAANNATSAFSYGTENNAWFPRVNGVFFKNHPQLLVAEGRVADVPFVAGDTKDEGTLFSLGNINITTNEKFEVYIKQNYYPETSKAALAPLFEAYPSNSAVGSRCDTDTSYAFTPEYKWMASLHGGLFFHAPRRFFLDRREGSNQCGHSGVSAQHSFPGLSARQ